MLILGWNCTSARSSGLRRTIYVCLITGLALETTLCAASASKEECVVTGRVVDSGGKPIVRAVVRVQSGVNSTGGTKTRDDGTFISVRFRYDPRTICRVDVVPTLDVPFAGQALIPAAVQANPPHEEPTRDPLMPTTKAIPGPGLGRNARLGGPSTVSAPAPFQRPSSRPAARDLKVGDIIAARTPSISGTVIRVDNGDALGDASVSVRKVGGAPTWGFSSQANERGEFRILAIPGDGEYELLVGGAYRLMERSLVHVQGDTQVRLRVVDRKTIRFRLVQAGTPKEAVPFEGSGKIRWGDRQLGVAIRAGEFEVTDLAPGDYSLSIPDLLWGGTALLNGAFRVAADTKEISVEVAIPKFVPLTLVDETTGRSLSDLRILVVAREASSYFVTDGNGGVRLPGVIGAYRIVVPGSKAGSEGNEIIVKEDTKNLELRIRGMPRISGTVVDAQGTGIARARIAAVSKGMAVGSDVADTQGRFSVTTPSVDGAKVYLRASTEGFAVTIRDVGEVRKENKLVLVPGVAVTIRLSFGDRAGMRPKMPAEVSLVQKSTNVVALNARFSDGETVRVLLEPGKYRPVLLGNKGEIVLQEVDVREEGTIVLTLP